MPAYASPRSRAWKPFRVLRSWLHPARARRLEVIAGERLEEFCAREVFAPLGMTSTCFRPPADWRSAIPPTEEDLTFRHRIIQGEVQDENCFVLGGVGGHAGLFSNALDPLLYAQCMLGRHNFSAPETVRLFTTRVLPPDSSRALGWDTPSQPSSSGKFFSRHSAGHLGYAGTSLWIDFRAPASHRAAYQSHLAAPPEPGHSHRPSCLSRCCHENIEQEGTKLP